MSSPPSHLWLGLLGAAAALPHCLGMCGAFALHLGGGSRLGALLRVGAWSLGKATTYLFLGALAGLLGAKLSAVLEGGWAQRGLSLACGAVMVVSGLTMLGLMPAGVRRRWSQEEALLGPALRGLLARPTSSGALALGLISGALPCPIVLGFLALSVQTQSVTAGLATMAGLGVGTLWALPLGAGAHLLGQGLRRRFAWVGAVVLVLLGAQTALRSTPAYHYLLGCPPVPRTAQAPVSAG